MSNQQHRYIINECRNHVLALNDRFKGLLRFGSGYTRFWPGLDLYIKSVYLHEAGGHVACGLP